MILGFQVVQTAEGVRYETEDATRIAELERWLGETIRPTRDLYIFGACSVRG